MTGILARAAGRTWACPLMLAGTLAGWAVFLGGLVVLGAVSRDEYVASEGGNRRQAGRAPIAVRSCGALLAGDPHLEISHHPLFALAQLHVVSLESDRAS